MYNPLFAITVNDEDVARSVVRHLLQAGGDGLKQAIRGNRGLTVIHSWGDAFASGTDAAWGLRKYLPHVLFVYISPEEKETMCGQKRWCCMELCQPHFFPSMILYDKTDGTILTCHVDPAGALHPARYMMPLNTQKSA